MAKCFVAVVADLEQSRRMKERASFSRQLEKHLRSINAHFSDEIWAPLTTVRGLDEISGLLRRPERAFEICARVNEMVHPARFRWGIAEGTIDVGIRTRDAGAMDGPAFHAASEAIARAEAERRTYAFSLPRLGPDQTEMLEASAQLYAEVVMAWTSTVPQVIAAIRSTTSQVEAAKSLKVTPQRVSQVVRRGSINRLIDFEAATRAVLKGGNDA
jgi:hypothetical protein